MRTIIKTNPEGRRERRGRETRQRILGAALKLFRQCGFLETTVEDITEAADVGKGTFFNYFPSKEHVLAGVGEMQLERIKAVLSEAREKDWELERTLPELMGRLAELPRSSPVLARSFLIAIVSNPKVSELISERMERGREMLAAYFRQMQRAGKMRSGVESKALAWLFQQSFFGHILLGVLSGGMPAKQLDFTADFLVQGMRGKETDSGTPRRSSGARRTR